MKKALMIFIISLLLFSCHTKKEKIIKENKTQNIEHNKKKQIDKAQEWLYSLFKCKNSNEYCFYLDNEEKVCTKRFYDFMIDSEAIYGASNLTYQEIPIALKKYKEKWSKIYTLRNETGGETWLFGRGNDDMENIKEVKVTKNSYLNYSVSVDYGNEIKTHSEVKLIEEHNGYKIDYSKTKFVN